MSTLRLGMPADLKHRLADSLPSQEYGVRPVVRSPGCQPSVLVMARSAIRPEASIRPNPYSTSSGAAGTSGAVATGGRRTTPVLPCSRPPGRARGGMRGAMGGAVMAASP
jgi:hypothetical protein